MSSPMFAIAHDKKILTKGFLCRDCGALIEDNFEGIGWVNDSLLCKSCIREIFKESD